jgi:hypothetical protein
MADAGDTRPNNLNCNGPRNLAIRWILEYIAHVLFQFKLEGKSTEETAPLALVLESEFQSALPVSMDS